MHNFWLATAGILLILSILVFPWIPGGFFLWNFMFFAPTFIGIIQIVFLVVGIIALFAAFA